MLSEVYTLSISFRMKNQGPRVLQGSGLYSQQISDWNLRTPVAYMSEANLEVKTRDFVFSQGSRDISANQQPQT